MSLLSHINAQIAENQIEAEHEAVLQRLRKKYGTLQPREAVGKTVKRVFTDSDNFVVLFEDNTFLFGSVDKDYDGCKEVVFFDPALEWVIEQDLMAVEDKADYDKVSEYYAGKSQAAEDHRLLHQVKTRFGVDKLRELFG